MKRILSLSVLAALAASVLFLACPSKGDIKIGAILPLTGTAAQFGIWKQQGLDIAVREINKAGGVNGRRLRIIYEDSQGDAKVGITALRRLLDVEKVGVVYSDVSAVTLAILPVTDKTTLVITSAQHPKITSGEYLAIRNYMSLEQEADAMAHYAYEKLGLRRVGVICGDAEAMIGYKDDFVRVFTGLGGASPAETYESGVADFRSQLTKLRADRIDGLYVVGWAETGAILKQAKELGLKVQFLGPTMFESPQMLSLAGQAAEGSIYTSLALGWPTETPVAKAFSAAYESLYAARPEAMSAIWYDMMYVLARAMQKVGDDPTALYKAVVGSTGHTGAMGPFGFDQKGNIVLQLAFKTIKDGKFELMPVK